MRCEAAPQLACWRPSQNGHQETPTATTRVPRRTQGWLRTGADACTFQSGLELRLIVRIDITIAEVWILVVIGGNPDAAHDRFAFSPRVNTHTRIRITVDLINVVLRVGFDALRRTLDT